MCHLAATASKTTVNNIVLNLDKLIQEEIVNSIKRTAGEDWCNMQLTQLCDTSLLMPKSREKSRVKYHKGPSMEQLYLIFT